MRALVSCIAATILSLLPNSSVVAQATQPSIDQFYGFWAPADEFKTWCSMPEADRDTEGDWIRLEKGKFDSGVGGHCEDVGQWMENGRLRLSAACTSEAGAEIVNREFWIERNGLMYFHEGDAKKKSRALRKCPQTKQQAAKAKSAPKAKLTTQSAPLLAKDIKPLAMPLPWPASGKIERVFGRSGNSHSDGLSISVPSGTPVTAVGDGVVVYSGSEVGKYGNLILLRHMGGWISVYALNRELLVKQSDVVARGQTIAASGATLHFELRQNSQPVDPMPLLSKPMAEGSSMQKK